jgi:hypothetical protein
MEDPTVVVVSYSGKEINAKLVYYGAGLCGKTTNLESIYEAVPETSRGKMVSMKTQSDRTLFFDLLPLDLGEIMGFKTRFLLYTVPGQVFYNATRKLVLKGADAIVFVADSEVGKMDENKESLGNLRTNLSEYGLRLEDTPWVIQYNKRDLPEVYTVEELNAELNPDGKVPFFEAVATQGKGVFETFRGISHLLMDKVTRELRRAPLAGSHGRAGRTDDTLAGTEPASLGILHAAPAPKAPEVLRESRESTRPEPVAPPAAYHYGRELTLPTGAPAASSATDAAISASDVRGPVAAPQSGTVRDHGAATVAGLQPPPPAETYGTQLDLGGSPASSSPERPGVASLEIARPGPASIESVAHTPGPQDVAPKQSQEMVVPVSLPRGATREIVLRIVITEGE